MNQADSGDAARYLRALVFLQARHLDPAGTDKPELVLSRAGLTVKEIAAALGKNAAAVAKTIERASKGKTNG